jgi:hypothetical protein
MKKKTIQQEYKIRLNCPSEKIIKSKKKYNRKQKHRKIENENI